MLRFLSIRDLLLIDTLDIEIKSGFTVFTGETGAGKSILLDAFSLALGARGNASLVRQGCSHATVSAEFSLESDVLPHIREICESGGIAFTSERFLLRRVQGRDGKTRAFVNDTPVALATLHQCALGLVEIHGQHDSRALLNPTQHLACLDAYAGLGCRRDALRTDWSQWKESSRAVEALTAERDETEAQREHGEAVLRELRDLAPQRGEASRLAALRQKMRNAEGLQTALSEILAGLQSADSPGDRLLSMSRQLLVLENSTSLDEVTAAMEALDTAIDRLEFASLQLHQALSELDFEAGELESVEERLFAMRALSRAHHSDADALPELMDRLETEQETTQAREASLAQAVALRDQAKARFEKGARELHELRIAASTRLAEQVNRHLPALFLPRARFRVEIAQDPSHPTVAGFDRAEFCVQTNPNTAWGRLGRVASGGELSRILLALKSELATVNSVSTLVFDEIDSGSGGAVAEAIGLYLERLSRRTQVIAITHAPQVAARAHNHLHVAKTEARESGNLTASVRYLNPSEANEEVARMLAGRQISKEARAAAARLREDSRARAG